MNDHPLKNKSVLMFCVEFFGYREQMLEGLKRLGCHVDMYDERPNNHFLTKTMIRYNVGLIRPSLRSYYRQIIEQNKDKDYDYVYVVKGEGVNEEIIAMLRAAYPRAKFILYLWDAVRNIPDCANRMGHYDRVLTFDPVDAKDYDLPFRSLFFGSDFPEAEEREDYTYDICFIGTAHSVRPRIVKQLEAYCRKEGLRMFSYLYSPHILVYMLNRLTNPDYRWVRKKDISFAPMGREQMQQLYRCSRCILDVEHPKQNGVTTRPLEMLKMQKKIITTNSQIAQFDFYRPENFFVIDRENPKLDKSFIEGKYMPVDEKTLYRYSVEGFLEEVFLT